MKKEGVETRRRASKANSYDEGIVQTTNSISGSENYSGTKICRLGFPVRFWVGPPNNTTSITLREAAGVATSLSSYVDGIKTHTEYQIVIGYSTANHLKNDYLQISLVSLRVYWLPNEPCYKRVKQ